MPGFDITNKWPARRKAPRQKDPRTQEQYCHISFFDGWQQVELGEVIECKRKTPLQEIRFQVLQFIR